jgi:hypothetical protein
MVDPEQAVLVTERQPNTTSLPYRFGRSLGRLTRVMLVIFTLSMGGLIVAPNLVPSPVRTAVIIACCFFGSLAALTTSLGRGQPVVFFGGVYVLLVAVGATLSAGSSRPGGPIIAIAIGTLAAAVGVVVSLFAMGRRMKELERLLFSEATSMAFFITMLGAITYGLLEVWVDAPAISMWTVWMLGMGSWAVLSLVLRKRYS